MAKKLLICLVLLFFSSQCFAVGSSEAINFVENTNHLLSGDESAVIFPVVRVSHSRQDYWVVSIISNDSVTGFAPVLDKREMEIAKGKLARSRLIKTMHYLRLYSSLKDDFSKQGTWVFNNLDVEFFNSLSSELKNERVDLTTIDSELDGYASLQLMSEDLKGQLTVMSLLVVDIADEMNEFKATEAKFFSDPDTNSLNNFVDALDTVFASLKSFDAKRADYLGDLDKLKQGVAQTDLSVESKRSLNTLANVPQKMMEVSSRLNNAVNLQEKTDEALTNVLNQNSELVQDLDLRENRSSAWLKIYGFDEEILEETSKKNLNNVDSLSTLIEIVLNEQYLYQWKEQKEVLLLQESWSKARAYYENGSFDSAESFANESKKHAVKIFKADLAEQEPVVNTDLLVTGAVLLIIAIIIIYILKNRDKLSSLVSAPEQEEEGVPLYDWEK
jgi:hypothetical protein